LIVRELITKLGFSLNQSNLNNVEKSVDSLKGRAEKAAGAFRNIVAAFAGFASVKNIINVADEMQNIRARIEQLPQTIGDSGQAFDDVAKHANAAGAKIDAYASLYTRIGNAAKDYITTQKDLIVITDTISHALGVSGVSAQEASSVMTQFSQALSSGVLQGQEFNSMAEAAPQYLDKLSETMQIPREQLKKMASDGKLTAKAVIEATRQMSGYFSEKFNKMPITVGRAITVIGNRFARMIDKLNRDSNFITKIANFILAAFDKIEGGIRFLINSFGGIGNMLRFVGTAIGVAFGAKAIAILMSFRAATFLALLPFIKMASLITLASLLIEDLYVWVNGGNSAIGRFAGEWEKVKYTILGVATAIGAAAGVFAVWKASIIGYSLAMRVYEAAIIAVAAAKRGLVAVAFALNLALAITPIGVIVVAIFSLIAAGTLLIANWENVKNWFSGLFSWFIDKFTDLGKFVNKIFGKLGDFFGMGSMSIEGKNSNILQNSTVEKNSNILQTAQVTPAKFLPNSMGIGATNLQSNTNVNITVPPGTTSEQVNILQRASEQIFSKVNNDKFARDLSVYSP